MKQVQVGGTGRGRFECVDGRCRVWRQGHIPRFPHASVITLRPLPPECNLYFPLHHTRVLYYTRKSINATIVILYTESPTARVQTTPAFSSVVFVSYYLQSRYQIVYCSFLFIHSGLCSFLYHGLQLHYQWLWGGGHKEFAHQQIIRLWISRNNVYK